METLIRTAFREIRQSYHSAITDWALNDKEQMLINLKEAKEKTDNLIQLLESEDGINT